MTNHKLEYWCEAVSAALEDVDALSKVTEYDIKLMAESLIISEEQQGMAFGTEFIPNPMQSQLADQKAKYESEIAELKKRDLIFRTNVANRHGPRVDVNDVYIEGNGVCYDVK